MFFFHVSAILALAASIASVQGKCCGSGLCVSSWEVPGPRPGSTKTMCNRWECNDGFVHGPFQCCGVSKCNVFCCNCDSVNGNICRESKKFRAREDGFMLESREALKQRDDDMFRTVNVSGTGNMTIEEFADYFEVDADDLDLVAKFHEYDKNKDGFLQADEMRLD